MKEETTLKRVAFKNSKLRNVFFLELKKKFGTWKKIIKKFNLYKSRLEKFRNGQILIPSTTFSEMIKHLEKSSQKKVLSNVELKSESWGMRKGGLTTYKKHKYIFEKGRKISGSATKYQFNLNMALEKGLCEFIGAFIGDGFTNKYGSTYMTQITGDCRLDYNYYFDILIPIIKRMSPNVVPKIYQKDNTIRLTIYSKELYELLTKRFAFKAGKKTFSVKIPDEILKTKDSMLIRATIRGIFDTDGGFYFDKRKEYKKAYPRIGLQMKSKKIINQIYGSLRKEGIPVTQTKEFSKIQINGFENCKKFIYRIGFSNPRHTSKFKFLEL